MEHHLNNSSPLTDPRNLFCCNPFWIPTQAALLSGCKCTWMHCGNLIIPQASNLHCVTSSKLILLVPHCSSCNKIDCTFRFLSIGLPSRRQHLCQLIPARSIRFLPLLIYLTLQHHPSVGPPHNKICDQSNQSLPVRLYRKTNHSPLATPSGQHKKTYGINQ